MARPVIFAVPAEIDLPSAPINPDWIIEGTPQTHAKDLARSADGTCTIVVWSCTPGRFNWHYAVDETLHVISGEAFVTDEKGEVHRLGPGDMAFFPAGSHSRWHVTQEIRKLAVCRHSMPGLLGLALRISTRVINRLTGFYGVEVAVSGKHVGQGADMLHCLGLSSVSRDIDKPAPHPLINPQKAGIGYESP